MKSYTKTLVLAGLVLCTITGAANAGTEVTNLDTAETFATLQAAIDDSDTLDGHTLEMLVSSHSTPELQITVSKSLTLQGAAGGSTLSPTMDTGTSGDARGWFLVPLGKTVTFRNLTFDGTPNKIFNAIRNHGTLTIEDCEFTEIKYEPSGPAYNGIAISHFGSGGAPMVVRDTTFSEIGRIGIHVFEPATIERCTYTGKGVGDWLDYFSCIGSFGASMGMATFDDCAVSGNRGVASSDGSTSAGLLATTFFGPGTGATITNSTFTDNTVGIAVGFDAFDTSDVCVNNCSITGNDFGMVNTSASVIVDAFDNWWGDASGPDDFTGTFEAENGPACCFPASFVTAMDVINADGTGDSVTDGNVDYCPWLTTPPPTLFDQDVTPDAIFGSGNDNGSFTIGRSGGVELGMRAKLRNPPLNVFNSNGDGSYTFNTGSGTASFPQSEWNFEWTVNTDYDGSTGDTVGDLTYEIGMDNDPGGGTDYLVFDPVSIGTIIPYTVPLGPIPYWDHSMGDNTTANGAGVEAADAPTYTGYLASFNVAQQSWKPTFYQNTAPYAWDPDVPGRYEYYLAALDGGTEVARTSITVVVADGSTMALEAATCQQDQDPCTPGVQIAVELWLRNPDDEEITGYQTFLAFDDVALTYEGAASSYTASPFGFHIQDLLTAEVLPGELRLDGNTFSAVGTTGDAKLATLIFTAAAECTAVGVDFDLSQAFASELSFDGVPLVTDLTDSPAITPDDTPPVLAPCPADITQPTDASSGCTGAIVTWTDPTATDNCDPSPVVVCDPPSGSFFPVGTTTVTCTATDECGNESTCTFDVIITDTVLVDVTVELTGSMPVTDRCIYFDVDSCSAGSSHELDFTGTAPSTSVATIEVPCGPWTIICAKDEQHTKWSNVSPLVLSGTKYTATVTLVLDGGDTDNDGDVDINDVTLFLAQFGNLTADGGCPWDGTTRDADFDNGGSVDSPDYAFLVANWLTTSFSCCYLPVIGGGRWGPLQDSLRVYDATTAAADLNLDGRIDVLDVEVLEARHGLSGELSRRMRLSHR